jgi:hypothetical protein
MGTVLEKKTKNCQSPGYDLVPGLAKDFSLAQFY